ncbi:MAG: hypothetical protein Q8N23_05885 [Archangium sp.]|nr:hypothetical protein [Archangium sp.]MDP3152180.1 hypothetical protein [Archangium sp.]MDP3574938.1 hypothetical protein [Archangium sp.]
MMPPKRISLWILAIALMGTGVFGAVVLRRTAESDSTQRMQVSTQYLRGYCQGLLSGTAWSADDAKGRGFSVFPSESTYTVTPQDSFARCVVQLKAGTVFKVVYFPD